MRNTVTLFTEKLLTTTVGSGTVVYTGEYMDYR